MYRLKYSPWSMEGAIGQNHITSDPKVMETRFVGYHEQTMARYWPEKN